MMTQLCGLLLLTLLLLTLLLPLGASAAEVSVFAASSLTEALRQAAVSYQKTHPATKVVLHFAGSQSLATQIEQGAPADLFISANSAVMQRLLQAQLIEMPRPLLCNRLIIAASKELKPPLHSISDLARPGILVAIGNSQVPVGNYTQQLFAGLATDPAYGAALITKITQNIVSHENMVKAIIAKLLLGEIDAGIVYRSDLAATNNLGLQAIALPARHNPQADYPMAKIKGGSKATERFMEFLSSTTASKIFTGQGFGLAAAGENHAAL